VTLTDTGPLVALVNRKDPNHAVCVAAAKGLPAGPLITTWPSFTEAMYLLYRAGGYAGQSALWQLRTGGRLALHDLSADEVDRMAVLMHKYQDTPMDLADASLVAAAERLRAKRIFSLDSDFRIYRLADGSILEIVP
jgi:predicted nucleic acid-binding protein